MSATDIAAWIGAITGTLVLIWDIEASQEASAFFRDIKQACKKAVR